MANEFIKNLIDQAHGHILNGDSETAIEMLSSIKLRVHEEEPMEEIKKFTLQADNDFNGYQQKMMNTADDPIRKDLNIAEANHQRAKKYLDFFDNLVRRYDI